MKRFALTPKAIAAARSTSKVSQLTDGMGLYLKLQWDGTVPAGKGHQWRFDYTRPKLAKRNVAKMGPATGKALAVAGKRNTLSFGAYPTVSIEQARAKAQDARTALADGCDPGEEKATDAALEKAAQAASAVAAQRTAAKLAPARTLLGEAQDFHGHKVATDEWTEAHAKQWLRLITDYVPAHVQLTPIDEVTREQLLDEVLRPIERTKRFATAHTLRKFLDQLFAACMRSKRCTSNPALDARPDMANTAAIAAKGNNAAITKPELLGPFLRAVDAYPGTVSRAALQAQMMLFQRPTIVCNMRWDQLDIAARTWTIEPGSARSKLSKSLKGEAHVVPLPTQMLALLEEMRALNGDSEWVFNSPKTPGKPITRTTLKNVLDRIGYAGQQTAHGMRATARTIIRKQLGVEREVIEEQLAHSPDTKYNGAYDRAEWADERGGMLQTWANYLDGLRKGGNVVQLKRAA